jgi:hypothetical protein
MYAHSCYPNPYVVRSLLHFHVSLLHRCSVQALVDEIHLEFTRASSTTSNVAGIPVPDTAALKDILQAFQFNPQ